MPVDAPSGSQPPISLGELLDADPLGSVGKTELLGECEEVAQMSEFHNYIQDVWTGPYLDI
jgi:hypothetical protein